MVKIATILVVVATLVVAIGRCFGGCRGHNQVIVPHLISHNLLPFVRIIVSRDIVSVSTLIDVLLSMTRV
jgi:hypothetical protein